MLPTHTCPARIPTRSEIQFPPVMSEMPIIANGRCAPCKGAWAGMQLDPDCQEVAWIAGA